MGAHVEQGSQLPRAEALQTLRARLQNIPTLARTAGSLLTKVNKQIVAREVSARLISPNPSEEQFKTHLMPQSELEGVTGRVYANAVHGGTAHEKQLLDVADSVITMTEPVLFDHYAMNAANAKAPEKDMPFGQSYQYEVRTAVVPLIETVLLTKSAREAYESMVNGSATELPETLQVGVKKVKSEGATDVLLDMAKKIGLEVPEERSNEAIAHTLGDLETAVTGLVNDISISDRTSLALNVAQELESNGGKLPRSVEVADVMSVLDGAKTFRPLLYGRRRAEETVLFKNGTYVVAIEGVASKLAHNKLRDDPQAQATLEQVLSEGTPFLVEITAEDPKGLHPEIIVHYYNDTTADGPSVKLRPIRNGRRNNSSPDTQG